MADTGQHRNAANAMFGLGDPRPVAGQPQAGGPTAPSGPAPMPPPGPVGTPQYVYVQAPPPMPGPATAASIPMLWRALIVALVVAAGANLYLAISQGQHLGNLASKQSDQINLLTRRLDSSDEHLAQLTGKFQVTAEKLGLTQQELSRARELATNIEKQQQVAVQRLNAAIAEKASAATVNQLQSEANTKFGTLSGDIAGTKKDLEATKEALTGTKGELSGAIARTHDELVALAHKTDRDYYEFHLNAKNAKQRMGSVTIQLLRTNTKKNLYTTYLFFDDKRTLRKDEAIDSPVYFYVQGAPTALELVVNKLGKNAIAGYISTPKGLFASTPNVLSARPGA